MKKDTHIILGICLFFLCAAGFLFYHGQTKTVLTEELISSEKYVEDSQAGLSSEKPEYAVYIFGAIKHPGIYRYHGTARIDDAIKALGGFKKNAAKESVNLAKPLTDGEQICILTKKQWKKQKKAQDSSGSISKQELLNINLAKKEDLMTLPGIGEAKALLIIHYREEHGNFAKPKDLMNISGIKEGVYNKIKALITT